ARSQLERWLRWTGPVARSGEVCGGDEITIQGGDEGVDLVLHVVPLHALGFHADLIALRGEAAIKRRGRGIRHDAFTPRTALAAAEGDPPALVPRGLPVDRADDRAAACAAVGVAAHDRLPRTEHGPKAMGEGSAG